MQYKEGKDGISLNAIKECVMNAVHPNIDSHCLHASKNDLFMALEEKEALLTYVLQENAYLRKRLEHCQDRLLTLESSQSNFFR